MKVRVLATNKEFPGRRRRIVYPQISDNHLAVLKTCSESLSNRFILLTDGAVYINLGGAIYRTQQK